MRKGCNCLKGKQLDIRLNKGKLLAGKGDRQTSKFVLLKNKFVLLIEAQSTDLSL